MKYVLNAYDGVKIKFMVRIRTRIKVRVVFYV